MKFQAIDRVVAAAVIASALTACGGGGDSPPMAQPVAITQQNAASVAAEAIDAGGAGMAGGGALTGVQVQAASAAPNSPMAALAGAVRLGLAAKAPAAVVGATFSETQLCTNGGSITVSVTVATPGTVAAGDHASLTFSNCVEGASTTSGVLSIAYVSINPAGTFVVVDLAASQFSATTLGIGGRINGSLRLTIDDTDPATSVLAVSGSSFSFERLFNGAVRASRTLTNYSYLLETTLATGDTAETFAYTVAGTFPRIGTVSFSAMTTQPVVTLAGGLHPISGAGTVTGASGASVTITVIAGGVQLDVDTNGDSVIDLTLYPTWDQIDAEL